MGVPANILQNVATYQLAGLAFLGNLNCFIANANKKFKDFDRIPHNLGDTVLFDLQPRFTTTNSLIANFQPAEQRAQALKVDQEISTSYEFTAEQFIFNVRDYMDRFGKAAIREIGTKVEANVALNCITNTYRFFGNGVAAINSYTQLAQALAMFRNYGSANGVAKGYLGDVDVPGIVNSGLTQFTPDRSNKAANSWDVGSFSNCNWYQSNLLPVHVAGSVGNNAATLTVTATVLDPVTGAIVGLTCTVSGAPGVAADAIKKYDKLQFKDGVAGHPNMRFLTFVGHEISANPVQLQATADAASDGASSVTVSIFPHLQLDPLSPEQNINNAVVAGMQLSVLPSHRSGMITSGDPLFLAMPQLPSEVPYPTANAYDPETGVSIRQYYGSRFGQNARGMVHDAIWGSTLVPEYAMALIFPL